MDHPPRRTAFLVAFLGLAALAEADGNQRREAFGQLHQDLDGPRIEAVYGPDDRRQPFEVKDPSVRGLTASVAALFPKSESRRRPDGMFQLDVTRFAEAYDLCPGERYEDEPSGGFCTGFLVGPDLLATAGHCLEDTRASSIRVVFDYEMVGPGKARTTLSADSVYEISKVLGRADEDGGKDWAVLRLDRLVVGREPLKLAFDSEVHKGQAVAVIGHPAGLPIKIAANAKVRETNADEPSFSANLDAFGGNSGSPVFDAKTWEVVGILVRGEADFVKRQRCKVAKHCKDEGCLGEDVSRIQQIRGALGPGQGN